MLPLPALDIIAHYLDSPGMGCYVRLSQVNLAARQYFMSDSAWARYDIHRVGGTKAVYTFKNYTLGGVAGHYMSFLETLDPAHRAWHLRLELDEAVGKPEWGDLYDNLYRLCTQSEVALAPQIVWEFYLQFSHYSKWKMSWSSSSYEHLLNSKPIFKAFISRAIQFPWTSDNVVTDHGHQDDRSINLELVRHRLPELCSPRLQNDKQFLLEMVRDSMNNFGHFELFFEPTFINEVVAQNPGLIEFLAYDFLYFESRSEFILRQRFSGLPYAFRSHRAFVLAAASQYGPVLEHASKELRDDEHVVVAAMQSIRDDNFQFTSQRLRDDKDLVLWAIKRNPRTWNHISLRLKLDPEILAHRYVYTKRRVTTPLHYPALGLRSEREWQEYLDQAMSKLPFKRNQHYN